MKQEPQKTEEIQESEITDFERELAQAILSALEHRGFYDCVKYLDTSLIEYIRPILHSYTAQREQAVREEERERWTRTLLDDTISITVEAKALGKILTTRKFVSIATAHQSGNRVPHLLAEEAVNEITEALTPNDTDKVRHETLR